jgi:hypothetical protein
MGYNTYTDRDVKSVTFYQPGSIPENPYTTNLTGYLMSCLTLTLCVWNLRIEFQKKQGLEI